MNELGPIDAVRRSGGERFHDRNRDLGFDLLSFWQWGASDVIGNTARGVLAEYLVAQAVGVADSNVREEWAAFDVQTPDRTKIEVKSAAFIQGWRQKTLSRISFGVRKTREWIKETNLLANEAKRQADVYVFALLAHTDQETLDPLDVAQWEFFVLPTVILDQRERSQHSITLTSLKKLTRSVNFGELPSAIAEAARAQQQTGQQSK